MKSFLFASNCLDVSNGPLYPFGYGLSYTNFSYSDFRLSSQEGDLVFFVGTYDTPGVSHVGFYVGDGMLLHCGDPIQYTSLNSNYWQSHLYAYGRPPYN